MTRFLYLRFKRANGPKAVLIMVVILILFGCQNVTAPPEPVAESKAIDIPIPDLSIVSASNPLVMQWRTSPDSLRTIADRMESGNGFVGSAGVLIFNAEDDGQIRLELTTGGQE